MSSAILIDSFRRESVTHNPYYEFFRDSVGKGDKLYHAGLGDIYSTVPDLQSGYGILTRSSIMNGQRVQLGTGIGSFFGKLFQFAKPLLKRGAKEVLNIGTDIANDVLEGNNARTSVKKHVKRRVQELLPTSIADAVNKRIGSGKQRRSKRKSSAGKRRVTKRDKYPVLGFL
jgi:hypothetical protein